MKASNNYVSLVVWLMISFAAGLIGGVASAHADDFYRQLIRPSWAPPSWVFGPVWTLLYILMGVAAWLVWNQRNRVSVLPTLGLFLAQLAANALWTWLFFGWHRGGFAFLEILVLWGLVALTLVRFWRVRPLAGGLLVPYLLWISFAIALTYSTWAQNPQTL